MKNNILAAAVAALLCSPLAFSQTASALTPAMVAGLSPVQFATLTNEQLQALSEAHIAALTGNQMRTLSAAQINALLLNQVAALTPAQTAGLANARALSLAQIGVLSPAAVAGIPATEMAAFSSEQLASLTAAQLEVLTSQQMDSVLPRLSNAQIQGLSVARVEALTVQQMDSALGRLSNYQVLNLSLARLNAFTREQHLSLRADLIPLLNPNYLGPWMAKNMAPDPTFTAEQAAALTQLQVARLPVGTLTTDQMTSWGRVHINAVPPGVAPTLLFRFSPAQAAWLTSYQIATVNPMNLTPTQQQLFRQIMTVAPTYCPSLADPAVYSVLPSALQSALANYRGIWDKSLAVNCFEAGTYKVSASCPADVKTNLLNSATNLLNINKQYMTATPTPPNFGTMRVADCRLP